MDTNNATDHHYHFKPHATDGKGFLNHLNPKDQTLFVALIVMAIAVPCIFLSVFALLCIRKHKEKKARRAEMLLHNAQGIAVDDPRRPEMITDHRY
ncbi:Hypothetical predicted protein [Octopus vulgaris]|nr:Hypothetical predicted protein [Octopus vulgaris]